MEEGSGGRILLFVFTLAVYTFFSTLLAPSTPIYVEQLGA